MEREYSAAMRELNAKCKDLTRKIRSINDEPVECEEAFDMDFKKLDKIRYELIAAHHRILTEGVSDRLTLDNELADAFKESCVKKQIEEMKVIGEIQRVYVNNKEKDTELNKDTQECFKEILETLEEKDDPEVSRSQAKRKLHDTKTQTRYILEKFYPDYQSELLTILEKLEKSSGMEDEEDQWLDLSDHEITPVLILKRAMIIEQHPTELTRFRFAPLI